MTFKVLLSDALDTDGDNIVDKVAVREADSLPTAPSDGEIIRSDGKLYIAINI